MKRKVTLFQNFQWDFATSCFIRRQMIYNTFYKLFRTWFEGEFAGNFIVTFYILNTGMETKAVYNSINTILSVLSIEAVNRFDLLILKTIYINQDSR